MKIKCFLAAFALSAAMIGSSAAAACDMSMLYKVKSSALFNECSREAQNGSAKAQHTLGYLYEAGEGVRANIQKAMEWYLKAAEQGYPAAQTSVGLMYYNGGGIPRDCTAAAGWFRKAAEQGDSMGQNMLGILYEHGEGVTQDKAETARW